MPSLEICFECDEATGNAGAGEDSLIFKDNPYCFACYQQVQIAELRAILGEIKQGISDVDLNKIDDVDFACRILEMEARIDEVLK